MKPNSIEFHSSNDTWVMRITKDRRLEVNEDVDVTDAAQEVLDRMQNILQHVEPVEEIDWKDQYEKQKRRAEMWVAKYEKDIGPLEYAVPAAPVQESVAVSEVLVKIARFLGVVQVYAQDINPKHELETDKPLHWKARELQGEVISLLDSTPPAAQRQWVGLTDDEIKLQWSVFWEADCHPWAIDFARAIEAKLKEKNT
jgi:hypothetical protein